MEQMQHEDFYDLSHKRNKNFGTPEYYKRKWDVLRNLSQERFQLYDLALKLTAVIQIRGFKMIAENPWHPTNFTNHFWFARTSLIDRNRTLRGDYFRKPTAYWYINCEPTFGETYQPTPKDKIKTITAGSGAQKTQRRMRGTTEENKFIDHKSQSGLCDEERSMISPDYARNFICDFILGKPQTNTQLTLF